MAVNTLIIITAYGSITPKPWKKAYLNISEELTNQRFLKEHPIVRDLSVVSFTFDDEFTIEANGQLSLV